MTSGPHCPHCGGVLDEGTGTPRSREQHRRYFALVRAVFHHWPEAHPIQFTNATECRKWLQMQAGHQEVGASIHLIGMNRERAMLLAEAAIRAAGSYAVPRLHGDVLVIHKPKSIAFAKLGHQAFCKLNDEIDAVILAETGMDAAQLLAEHEAAA